MTKYLLASPACLALATSLFAVPALAQAPASPAPAAPAAPAPSTPAPAAAVPATPAPAAAAPGAAAPTKATHASARSARVEQLQNALNSNGATLTVDGKMGSKTKAALMDFQKAHGLKVTGRPDKETRDALKTTG
jgi:peptidoglycan hydrolase-like protein with peptidoglycan-binding domain